LAPESGLVLLKFNLIGLHAADPLLNVVGGGLGAIILCPEINGYLEGFCVKVEVPLLSVAVVGLFLDDDGGVVLSQ
jgi:hypothetical protein